MSNWRLQCNYCWLQFPLVSKCTLCVETCRTPSYYDLWLLKIKFFAISDLICYSICSSKHNWLLWTWILCMLLELPWWWLQLTLHNKILWLVDLLEIVVQQCWHCNFLFPTMRESHYKLLTSVLLMFIVVLIYCDYSIGEAYLLDFFFLHFDTLVRCKT